MGDGTSIDEARLRERQMLIAGYAMGAAVSTMIYAGIDMGLYPALRSAGPATSEEFAAATGFHERWLREWLRQQAAARLLEYDRATGRFSISPEVAALLAEPDELRSLRPNFTSLTMRYGILDRLPEAFRTGLGIRWDDRGPRAAETTENLFANWYRQVLVPVALPMLEGVVPALERGGRVMDVGCGTGLAMIEMAKAFPRAQFHGWEASRQAIERGRQHALDAGTPNVTFHDVADEPMLVEPSFDLVLTFDCLHDMARPHEAVAAIRRTIRPDGAWFIADINGQPSFEDNLDRNPLAAMMYAISVTSCMSSALSEPDGAGLGTLGLPEPAMRDLVTGAGFTRFRRIEQLQHPINAYYEARL